MVKTLENLVFSPLGKSASVFKRYGPTAILVASSVLPFTARTARAEIPDPAVDVVLCSVPQDCFDQGKKAYGRGNYGLASRLFERSCALADDPYSRAILYHNIGLTYESHGAPEDAIIYFNRYRETDENFLRAEASSRRAPEPPEIEGVERRFEYLEKWAEARRLSKTGKFQDAYNLLTEVYNIVNGFNLQNTRLSVLLDIARNHERSGELRRAIDTYSLYLGDPNAGAEAKGRVEEEIERLRTPPEQLPPGLLDDSQQEIQPSDDTLQRPSFARRHLGSILSGSIAAGATIAAVTLNGVAVSRYDESCDGRGCDPDAIGGVQSLRTGRDVSYGIAATAGAVAVGLLVWELLGNRNPDKSKGPKAKLSLGGATFDF